MYSGKIAVPPGGRVGQIASLFKEKIKKHVFLENQQVEL
jgi:hypothetical protein